MPSISEISVTIKANTKQFVKNLKKATRSVASFGKSIMSGLSNALFSLKGLLVGVFAGVAFKELIGGALKSASSLEALNAQFKTLLGSQEKATQRMKEITEFSASTPFQVEDIAQANKILESLTEGALSTAEGMKLVGDTASFANQPINEIAVQIGRLFSGIQAGTAVGEPLARLNEIGAISSKAKVEIAGLINTGQKGGEVWAKVERELGKFKGTMEAMSLTASGLWSTLKDNLNFVLADLGNALLPMVKAGMSEGIKLIQSLRESMKGITVDFSRLAKVGIAFVKMIEIMGNAIGEMFSGGDVNKAMQSFETNILKVFGTIAFFMKEMGKAQGTFGGDTKDTLSILWIAIKSFGLTIINFFGSVFNFIEDRVKSTIKFWVSNFKNVGKLIADDITIAEFFEAQGQNVKDGFNQVEKDFLNFEKSLDTLSGTFEKQLEEFGKKTQKKKGGSASKFFENLLGNKGERNKFIQEFLKDVQTKFEDWKSKQLDLDIDANVDIGSEMGGKIADEIKSVAPQLAVKGSQAVASALAGRENEQQRMLKINQEQLREQKKLNMQMTAFINGVNLTGGLFTEDIPIFKGLPN